MACAGYCFATASPLADPVALMLARRLYFKASCLLGCSCPLCCVVGAWPALSGAQPGHAANIGAEVQSVWRSLPAAGVEILFYVL